MRVIHKFGPVKVNKPLVVENFHKFTHFALQNRELYIWCEIDLEHVLERSTQFLVVGTGQTYEEYWKHKSTLIDPAGYVWHLLEEIDPILELAKII